MARTAVAVVVALLLLCVFLPTQGQEQFYEKYAFTKVMEHCMGGEIYHDYLTQVTKAIRLCATQPQTQLLAARDSSYTPFGPYYPYSGQSSGSNYPISAAIQNSRVVVGPSPRPQRQYRPNTRPAPRPINPLRPTPLPTSPQRPQITLVNTQDGFVNPTGYGFNNNDLDNRDVPIYRPYNHQHGQQLWDANSISTAAYRFNEAMSNFTCVLAAINAIDTDLSVKVDSFANYYYTIPIDGALRQDLIQGVHLCTTMTNCLRADQTGVPLPYNLQRTLAFLKCERRTRLTSCLKHDIRKNLAHFDVRALPEDGGRTDAVDKLVAILVGSDASDELEVY